MLSRLKNALGVGRSAAVRITSHRKTPAFCGGLAIGIAGWSAAHPFVATFGFSRETVAALLLATAGAFAAGDFLARRRAVHLHGLPSLLAAAWLVLLPSILAAAESLVAFSAPSLLAFSGYRLLVLFAAAVLAFGFPAGCVGDILGRCQKRGNGSVAVFGAAAGIAANAFLIAPIAGLHAPLLCITVCVATAWFVKLARGRLEATADDIEPDGEVAPPELRHLASACIVAILCGGCARVLAQLTPEAAYLLATGACAFLVGTASVPWLRRRLGGEAESRRVGCFLAATAALVPLAGFSWLVERHLDVNSYVSSVFWLTTVRAGMVAAVFLPLGVGCRLTTGSVGRRSGAIAFSAAAGLAATGWLLPAVGVVIVVVGAAACLVVLNLGATRASRPATRLGWGVAAIGGVAVAGAAFGARNYEPARAARLLFSTEAFIAHQRGVPAELLPHLDDTRLVSASELAVGTVTTWTQRGEGLLVRVNGIPVAATSRRPERCPLPTAEVLRVALPLALHYSPESLLILGDPLGLAEATAAGFPLRTIACYDGLGAERVVEQTADDRLTRESVEPRLAVVAEKRTFDVVVSDPGVPSLPSSAAYFTREFYARAADRLAAGGVFCQRLRYSDLGPGPLPTLAATTRGLFGDVMIIEIGSGDYALLGAKAGSVLVRDGLVQRLQKPHLRRALAALGWDWCVPLNLAAVGKEGLLALAEGAGGPNTASNGWFAATLPPEVMRWGAKSQELQEATTGLTTRLAAIGVPPSDERDVLDRIAEVTGQHRLMTEYPDQPWAYRKEIRTKLKETPRSVIQPVAGEVRQVMHPDDRRRLDYFGALGDATKKPGPETLIELERFAEPYDPLLSYFLHHEAAAICGRLGESGAAAELDHRLHAAHYADPRDRSVRNEVAALELLVRRPELAAGDVERFDQLNGLIEVLLGRWEARGMANPKSPEAVMIDIDKSLGATAAAIEAMGPLAASAGLTDEQWALRRSAIERTLTRPLRSYRTTLLPHVRSAQRKAAEAASGSAEELEPMLPDLDSLDADVSMDD